MPNTIFNTRIQHKIDTTQGWATNPVLNNGELGFERTASGEIKFKVGNGEDTWSNLPYVITEDENNIDEVCISTAEAPSTSQYKMWVNTGAANDQQALESSEVYYIDFSLTTQNNEEIISTNDSYASIQTEYGANSIVVARLHNGTDTLFAPLLEYVDSENTFYFGAPSNNEFKIISLNSNDICTVSTMSLGGGTGFELEEDGNMLLENGILKARYGEPYTSFGSLYIIDENTETKGPDTYINRDINEDLNLAIMLLYNLDNSYPIITAEENSSTPINLIIHYKDNTTKIIETAVQTTELAEGAYYAGDSQLAGLMDMDDMESEEQQELLTYIQNHPDSYLFINLKTVEDGQEITQIIFLAPLSWMASENGADFVGIEVEGEKTVPYPIPASALRAGKGISIDSTTGAISLSYGNKKADYNVKSFCIDGSNQANSQIMGSLYGWYAQYSSFESWESNTSPNSFYNTSELTAKHYKEGQYEEDVKFLDYETFSYQNTIDYTTDEYSTIPFYYINNDEINSLTENNLVELKELPYNDNLLYTAAQGALDSTNLEANIFYAGTYNTNDSINTILTNYSITPVDNTQPAILFVLLDEPYGQSFFWAFSNENDLRIDKNLIFTQIKTITSYNNMPFSIFNSNNKLNSEYDQLVLGNRNDLQDNNSDCLIIGADNQIFNNSTRFYVCYSGSQPLLHIHGNTIELNGDVKINGNSYNNSSDNKDSNITVQTSINPSDTVNPVSGYAVDEYFNNQTQNYIQKYDFIESVQDGYSQGWATLISGVYSQDYNSYSTYDENGNLSTNSSDGTYGDSDFINIDIVPENGSFAIDYFYNATNNPQIYEFDENYNYIGSQIGILTSLENGTGYNFTRSSKSIYYIKFIITDSGSNIFYQTDIPIYTDRIKSQYLPKISHISDANYITDTTNTSLEEIALNYNALAAEFNNLLTHLHNAGYMSYTS